MSPCELEALGRATHGEGIWTELLPIAKCSASKESQRFILHRIWIDKGICTLVQIQNPAAFGSGQMGLVRNVSLQDGYDDDSATFLLSCAGQTSLCPSALERSFSPESHGQSLAVLMAPESGGSTWVTPQLSQSQTLRRCSSKTVVCVNKQIYCGGRWGENGARLQGMAVKEGA